jgi:class 3 adenylate cyclase
VALATASAAGHPRWSLAVAAWFAGAPLLFRTLVDPEPLRRVLDDTVPDIVDFTSRSERIAPEQVVEVLNDLFSAFDRLCRDRRLEKIKTIGDAYMVVGGCPSRGPTTPRRWPRWPWRYRRRWRRASTRAASPYRFALASTPARWPWSVAAFELVELSIVRRAHAPGPLVEHFLQCALHG